jgi:hypothetical protein
MEFASGDVPKRLRQNGSVSVARQWDAVDAWSLLQRALGAVTHGGEGSPTPISMSGVDGLLTGQLGTASGLSADASRRVETTARFDVADLR